MIGVALDLHGSSINDRNERPASEPAQRKRRGKPQRLAGDYLLWHPHIGQDLLFWLGAAGGGQDHLRSQQTERVAPRERGCGGWPAVT